MGYNPAEKRDGKGRWTKSETTAWLDRHPVDAKNIVAMWDQATPGEREAGEVWYPHAHMLATALGKKYGVSTQEAAGLLATYSPQTPWGQNVMMAGEALRESKALGGPGAHVFYHHDETTPNTVEEREGVMAPGVSRNRAARMMAGEDPDEVLAGGRNKNGSLKPNSLKVRAFADLIANGTQPDPANPRVVIDRHAAGVARGVRMTDDDYGFEGPSSSVKKFTAYTEAYKEAARQISAKVGHTVPPEAVQAATWLTRQRLNSQAETQVGKTRDKLGKQDAADLRSYIDQYLPGAKTFLPKVGYSDLAKQTARVDIDLASANAQRQPKPQQTVQPKPGPAQYGATTAAVIAITGALTAGLGTAALVQRIHSDLLAWNIDETTIASVLRLVKRGTAHTPNARLKGQGARLTPHIAVAKTHELARRAAYICNAAFRMQRELDSGVSPAEALKHEQRNFALHEQARRGRLDAEAQVQVAADFFGQREHDGTLVGWYLNPLLNNEAECIAANGHNFYAEKGTVIGLPGAVHNNCGCYAGPPWTGAALVDDVFHNLRALKPVSHAKFQLRKRKGA